MMNKAKSKSVTMAALHDDWMQDREYVREYDALADEFALATGTKLRVQFEG